MASVPHPRSVKQGSSVVDAAMLCERKSSVFYSRPSLMCNPSSLELNLERSYFPRPWLARYRPTLASVYSDYLGLCSATNIERRSLFREYWNKHLSLLTVDIVVETRFASCLQCLKFSTLTLPEILQTRPLVLATGQRRILLQSTLYRLTRSRYLHLPFLKEVSRRGPQYSERASTLTGTSDIFVDFLIDFLFKFVDSGACP